MSQLIWIMARIALVRICYTFTLLFTAFFSMKHSPSFPFRLLQPKYWLSWFAVLFWWLLTQLLPFRAQLGLGCALGSLLYRVDISRCKVARRNLALCFPGLDEQAREKLLRDNMQSTCMGIFESGTAWFMPHFRFRHRYTMEGLENLNHAIEAKRGVLFMGMHFTAIEIGAAFVNFQCGIHGFYRPHSNPVYEYVQLRGRLRHNGVSTMIPNKDVRRAVKLLRKGAVINYAPDQDFGFHRYVFAPLFGLPAATVEAPAQLAKAGAAEVIPWTVIRQRCGSYRIKIYPSITAHLTEDSLHNAHVINTYVEQRIREHPEQYLWAHRRFKTRPSGEATLYASL